MSLALSIWAALQAGAVGASPGPPPDVRHRLDATVDDSAGVIRGTARIAFRHRRAYPLRRIDFSLEYNAFRPGARSWPAGAAPAPDRTGFQRILAFHLDGSPVALEWPRAPDSTVARLTLPRALLPGDSITIALEWEGRPPALPWRTERRGRRLDLVGWYPRLMEDSLALTSVPMPALGKFTVVLDLADQQVVGGTGVVSCGDPGWREVEEPTFPGEAVGPGMGGAPGAADGCDGAAPGRRRVGWTADAVTEVAYAASPAFRFEVGDIHGDSVYALYEEGGERRWGAGLATRRAEAALAWLTEVGGAYPWPQLTVVEGLDRAGRALPMVVLADSPSQAALLNLIGLVYTRQILPGSNPVLAVGAAAFQAAWFFEQLGGRDYYARIERQIVGWNLDGLALGRPEPLPDPSSTSPCSNTACRRVEFMLHQLRWWAGNDASIKRLFRGHVERYGLAPAVTGSFQALARQLIQPSPDPLYRQVPLAVLYDDAVVGTERERLPDGAWRTVALLERRADGVFPRTVRVIAEEDTSEVRTPGVAVRESVTVKTRTRPRRVVLDPNVQSHDWNMLNNQRGFGFSPGMLLGRNRPSDSYLDTYFSRRSARDRLTRGWAPTLWYNDLGGWVVGARLREDYLGRFELNEAWASVSTGAGAGAGDGRTVPHGWLALRNPVWLRKPGWAQELAGGWVEGRAAVEAGVERRFRRGVSDSTVRTLGLGVGWLVVTDTAWLDRGHYDDAGTVELTLSGRRLDRGDGWRTGLEVTATGGWAYDAGGGTGVRGAYGRFLASAAVRGRVAPRLYLGVRGMAGAVVSADSLPRQRRLFLAGADPYERFASPFLRSRGAILVRPGLNYHAPGGGGLRGLDPRLSGEHVIAGSAEVEYGLLDRRAPGVVGRVALVAFLDGGLADGDLDGGGERLRSVADGGIGIRSDHRIGRTDFQVRVELPLWVSRPELAQDDDPGSAVGIRWAFGFSPSFLPR